MKKLLITIALLLFALRTVGCTPKPPQPPQPPTPPTPPPFTILTAHDGKFWQGSTEFKFVGFSPCCDDPDTPGVDEGYRDNWSLMSKDALDRAKKEGVTFVFMRPGPYDSLAPVFPGSGYDILPHLRESVLYANSLDIVVEVGLIDFWTLASGHNLWNDTCKITESSVPERYLSWVDAIVSSVGSLNITYNIGNEAFRCLRAPTVWDTEIMAKVRQVETARNWQHRLIGASWWLPDVRPEANPDYIALQDVFFAPSPLFNKPVILNEDDGLYHNPKMWKDVILKAKSNGTYVAYWRGIQSDAEEAFFFGLGADPGLRCKDAPPISRFEMGLRAGPNPFVDATPKVCDSEWCQAHGAPGQGCCAYGSEDSQGWSQRVICESEHGPYVWSFNDTLCDPYAQPNSVCWTSGNPLQATMSSTVGTVKLCAEKDGVCRSLQIGQ